MIGTRCHAQGLATSLDSTMWGRGLAELPLSPYKVKYDEAGRACPELANGPLEWTLGNGVKTSRLYYPWSTQGGRLQSISSVILSNGVTRQNLVYGYDANGNVTSVQDTVAGETLSYAYDVLDRLTGVSGVYNESYTYNPTTGNLASKAGQTLTYGAANHPHAATAMGSNIYTYDANGNMLTRKISGVTYTLSYDAEGRLVSISGGGMTASYTYNGDGERVKAAITTGGSTKTTAYVGDYFEVSLGAAASTPPPVTQNCVTSKCAFLPFVTSPMAAIPNGQASTSYYYLGGQRIAIRVQSRQLGVIDGTYYPLSDHLGGTTVTLDASANRFSELRYKAWGQTRFTYGTTPTQRRYTGQLEAEAGLYFYNARWYDPALGRFAQADTLIPDPRNPLTWDRYAYVYNNPQKYTDPSGHDICDDDGNCFDQNTRINRRGLAMGWPKNSPPRNSSVSSPSYDPKLLEKNLQETFSFVDFLGRIAFEPYDWYRIGVDCYKKQCNGWDFIGLLPFIPGGISKYGDETLGILERTVGHHVIPRQTLKMLPEDVAKAVRGGKGAPNIWYIPEKHHKIIHSGSGRGGCYNAVWRIALEKLLTTRSYLTTQYIFTIRDQIVNAFDI